MRNHLVKPRGWMHKNRDYLMFEKERFLGDASAVVRRLAHCVTMPDELAIFFKAVSEALESHDLERLQMHEVEGRRLAWQYKEESAALMVMILNTLNGHSIAEAKQPDDLTTLKRAEVRRE